MTEELLLVSERGIINIQDHIHKKGNLLVIKQETGSGISKKGS